MVNAEILAYGVIGDWGLNARDILRQLEAAKDAKQITVRIHSPGGDAIEGIAIHNALQRHPARKIVHIDGEASSAASLVAMAGDEIVMAETAIMMLHDPWCGIQGDADTMRAAAEMLDTIARAYVAGYARKTSRSEEETRALMKKHAFPGGAYLTAKDAVAAGLADKVGAPVAAKALARAAHRDLSRAPAAVALLYAAAPVCPAPPHLPVMSDSQDRKHLGLAKTLSKRCAALATHAQKCSESDHPGLKALGAGLAESMAQHVAAVKASFPDMEPDGDEGDEEKAEKDRKEMSATISFCEELTGKKGAELKPALMLLSQQAREHKEAGVVSEEQHRLTLLDSMVKTKADGGSQKIRPDQKKLFESWTLAELQNWQKTAPEQGPKLAVVVQPAHVLDGRPPELEKKSEEELLKTGAQMLGRE